MRVNEPGNGSKQKAHFYHVFYFHEVRRLLSYDYKSNGRKKNKLSPAQERGNQVFWGERLAHGVRPSGLHGEIGEGGLLYPNPAANLVSEEREEWLFE